MWRRGSVCAPRGVVAQCGYDSSGLSHGVPRRWVPSSYLLRDARSQRDRLKSLRPRLATSRAGSACARHYRPWLSTTLAWRLRCNRLRKTPTPTSVDACALALDRPRRHPSGCFVHASLALTSHDYALVKPIACSDDARRPFPLAAATPVCPLRSPPAWKLPRTAAIRAGSARSPCNASPRRAPLAPHVALATPALARIQAPARVVCTAPGQEILHVQDLRVHFRLTLRQHRAPPSSVSPPHAT
jgi:hypothetical protein